MFDYLAISILVTIFFIIFVTIIVWKRYYDNIENFSVLNSSSIRTLIATRIASDKEISDKIISAASAEVLEKKTIFDTAATNADRAASQKAVAEAEYKLCQSELIEIQKIIKDQSLYGLGAAAGAGLATGTVSGTDPGALTNAPAAVSPLPSTAATAGTATAGTTTASTATAAPETSASGSAKPVTASDPSAKPVTASDSSAKPEADKPAATADTPAADPTAPTVPLKKIAISNTKLIPAILSVGDTFKLIPAFTPPNATVKNLNWTSSSPETASVDNSGVISGIASGSATITAAVGDGKIKTTAKIKVASAAESITLDNPTLNLKVKKSGTVTASVVPSSANQTTTGTISDTKIATLKGPVKGKYTITGVKAGTATLTIKAGKQTATSTITVS